MVKGTVSMVGKVSPMMAVFAELALPQSVPDHGHVDLLAGVKAVIIRREQSVRLREEYPKGLKKIPRRRSVRSAETWYRRSWPWPVDQHGEQIAEDGVLVGDLLIEGIGEVARDQSSPARGLLHQEVVQHQDVDEAEDRRAGADCQCERQGCRQQGTRGPGVSTGLKTDILLQILDLIHTSHVPDLFLHPAGTLPSLWAQHVEHRRRRQSGR